MKRLLKTHLDRERTLLQRLAFFDPLFTAMFGWRGRGAIIVASVLLFSAAVVWMEPFGASWQTTDDRGGILQLMLVMPLSAFLVANWVVEFALKGWQVLVWAVSGRLWVKARTFIAAGLFVAFSILALYFHVRIRDGDLYSPFLLFFAALLLFASIVLAWEDSVRKEFSNQSEETTP